MIELPDLPEIEIPDPPEIEIPDWIGKEIMPPEFPKFPKIDIPTSEEVWGKPPQLPDPENGRFLPEPPEPPMPPEELMDRIFPKGEVAKPFAWATGILNDLLDYTPIGELPIIGDMIDAATMFAIRRAYPKQQMEQSVEFAEFIPLGDLLPSMTAGLFGSEMNERRHRRG